MNVNGKSLCTRCFEEYNKENELCRHCGYSENSLADNSSALPAGSMLMGRFVTGKVLGKGGFGITYLSYDLKNERKVAIKEYMPDNLSYRTPGSTTISTYPGEMEEFYKQGAEKFYEEAKTISRFNGHPNIINVLEFFHENNTAYFVMEYIDGVDFKAYVEQKGGRIPEDECIKLLLPVMDALIVVHSIGILHRDISPDNIFITSGGVVKLLDFGAARQVLGEKSKSLSVILKQGFAPFEQYQTRGNQGPWTDIYSLAATIYYCLVGSVPESVMDRINNDGMKTVAMISLGIQPGMAKILSKALAVKEAQRYQTVNELKQALEGIGYENTGFYKTADVMPVKKSNKLSVIIGVAAVAVLLLSGIVYSLSFLIPNDHPKNNGKNAAAFDVNETKAPTESAVIDVEKSPESMESTATETETTAEQKPTPRTAGKEDTIKASETAKPAETTVPSPTYGGARDSGITTVTNIDYQYVTSAFTVKSRYTGEWKDNKPNGKGTLTIAGGNAYCAHGDRITGNFVDGVLNGQVKCEYADGAKYDGNYVNGLRHGHGTLVWSNGNKYVGEFTNDFVEGKGTFYFADGAKYTGEFKHNAIEGKGTKYFTNGDRYEGQFVQANREGTGIYYFADGSKYTGEWKNDVREGQGIMYWASTGNRYEGQWKNNVREGKGTYYWKDGRKYTGEHVNDNIEGYGTYYDMDGNIIKQGEWKNNSYIGS